MSVNLRPGAFLWLRPVALDTFLDRHNQTRLEESISGGTSHLTSNSSLVSLVLGELRGYKNRCAFGTLEDGTQVFAKFYSTSTLAQRNGLLRELSFLADKRMQQFQFSNIQNVLDAEGREKIPFIPKLSGLYDLVDPAQEDGETQARIILLPTIPSSFLTIKQLAAANIRSPRLRRLLFAKASTALGMLHELGYLHGDISHGNFLFYVADPPEQSRILIVDFERASMQSKISFDYAARGEVAGLRRLFRATREEPSET